MAKVNFPFVNLPNEFISLLKKNASYISYPSDVVSFLAPNKAIINILESAFSEFEDKRGLEKICLALGWLGFRDRFASIYVYKTVYGDFPKKSNLALIEDVKNFETRFESHSVNSSSRLFLLAFYLKLANFEIQSQEDNQF